MRTFNCKHKPKHTTKMKVFNGNGFFKGFIMTTRNCKASFHYEDFVSLYCKHRRYSINKLILIKNKKRSDENV